MPDIALLVNPTAGKGRAGRLAVQVAAALRGDGADVRTLEGRDAGEALDLARRAVSDGVDLLVAMGGDGLVHLALQAVVGTPTPLAVIPAGTGNDFAAMLGLPSDPLLAVQVATAGRTRVIDAVRTETDDGRVEWFGCVLGAGFDSAVNERANRMSWPRGRRRYDIAIMAELAVFKAERFSIAYDDEPAQDVGAMLVAVGNARSYGAGMRICPDAQIDDGLLDVTVLGPVGKIDFLRTFPKVFKGTHTSHPAVTTRRARRVRLESEGVVAYADGERLAPLPLTCECVPSAVHVLVPKEPPPDTAR